MQFLDIKRTSLKCNFNMVDFPSFAISFTIASAGLANYPPFPSLIFMLYIVVPKGYDLFVKIENFCTMN